VGSHLCRVLESHGWQVTRAVRNPSRELESAVQLELLNQPERWQAEMRSCSHVVHLAACVHRMKADRLLDVECHRINVLGSRFVAEQALAAGVKRFVFLSSIKVNGEGGERPFRDDDVPGPTDAYGRSKLAAEEALKKLWVGRDMTLVIIRPPLIYGPGVKANFCRLMRLSASRIPLPFGALENARSFLGVHNLADFIERCLDHPSAGQRTWLVSDGEDLSTAELLRRIRLLMGRQPSIFSIPLDGMRQLTYSLGLRRSYDRLVGSLRVDSEPARRLLGWQAPFSVDEELARTVRAYLRERST
jgi:nucleoside-diphosphate-sugar epimerase